METCEKPIPVMLEMPLERLEAEITKLAGNLASAECRWLQLIGQYDRRAGYESWACQSCAHWLNWHCGLSMRSAREHVRVARALDDLPLITAGFRAGKLSYSKVRAMTRVATPAIEPELIQIADHATASQVERAVRAYRSVQPDNDNDDTPAANVRHMARYLRYDWDDDGSLKGSFRMPPEMTAIFLAAIAHAREHVPAEPNDDDGPAGPSDPAAATNIDALMLMAETLLAHGTSEQSGSRFQINVNVDAEVLEGHTGGVCELDDGPALAAETARRLACDASIVNVVRDEHGKVMWTGKLAPAISAATRRAIRARDKGCRFPGCGGRVFTHVHHVRHRAQHGGNEVTNLVELCWFHHRLVHEGGWNVRFDETGERLAMRPDGHVLARPEPPPPSDRHEIERANTAAGHEIKPATCIPRRYGDRFDLGEIVSGLIAAEARPGRN